MGQNVCTKQNPKTGPEVPGKNKFDREKGQGKLLILRKNIIPVCSSEKGDKKITDLTFI